MVWGKGIKDTKAGQPSRLPLFTWSLQDKTPLSEDDRIAYPPLITGIWLLSGDKRLILCISQTYGIIVVTITFLKGSSHKEDEHSYLCHAIHRLSFSNIECTNVFLFHAFEEEEADRKWRSLKEVIKRSEAPLA